MAGVTLSLSPPPSVLANLSNPLTPTALFRTILFQVAVLGFGTSIIYLIVFPRIKRVYESSLIEVGSFESMRYKSRAVDFLFGYIPSPWRNVPTMKIQREFKAVTSMKDYLKTRSAFTLYFFLRMCCLIIILQVTGALLTTAGWHDITAPGGLFYDLIYARVNNAENGAHISSYLGVCAVGITVIWKYRKQFINGEPELTALIACALVVGLHEGAWIVFYYMAYGRYLFDIELINNILVDIGFTAMIVFFVVTFWKFPYQRLSLKMFRVPFIILIGYLYLWFFLPVLFNPTYYSFLPISTLNNWKFGQDIFNATPWYSDALTNGFEVGGWLVLSASMIVQIIRAKE